MSEARGYIVYTSSRIQTFEPEPFLPRAVVGHSVHPIYCGKIEKWPRGPFEHRKDAEYYLGGERITFRGLYMKVTEKEALIEFLTSSDALLFLQSMLSEQVDLFIQDEDTWIHSYVGFVFLTHTHPRVKTEVLTIHRRYEDGDLTLVKDIIRRHQIMNEHIAEENSQLREENERLHRVACSTGIDEVMDRKRRLSKRTVREIVEAKKLEAMEDMNSRCEALAVLDIRPEFPPTLSDKERKFQMFVSEKCIVKQDVYCPLAQIIKEFEIWCDSMGYKYYYPKELGICALFAWLGLIVERVRLEYPVDSGKYTTTSFLFGIALSY